MSDQRWTVLLYLCGDTDALAENIKQDAEEALRAVLSPNLSVGLFVDLTQSLDPQGAIRYQLRQGEPPLKEPLGPLNSGSTATLRDFLVWGMRELPADHYALIFGGTGMLDPHSIVGAFHNNWTDVFTICDDATSQSGMDVAELRSVLESVLDETQVDRFRVIGFDMCKMQFLEVAYEFETTAEIVIAAQTAVPRTGWNYEALLNTWSTAIAGPHGDDALIPGEPTPSDIARLIVREAVAAYTPHVAEGAAALVSAVDVLRLNDLTRDFDAFTLAYMQALGDDMAWRAREAVNKAILVDETTYDLHLVLRSVSTRLTEQATEDFRLWLGRLLTKADAARRMDFASALERACTRLRATAGTNLRTLPAEAVQTIETCVQTLRQIRRMSKDRSKTTLDDIQLPTAKIQGRDLWEQCFADTAALPVRLREEYEALKQERERTLVLAALAKRTLRHFGGGPGENVILERASTAPAGQDPRCGLALYRPEKLDRLVDSNYLKLEFSRRVHWAAMLGAINLIAHDAQSLWRVVSSMLASADPRGRDDLIERLVGQTSVGTSYRDQFRALTPSPLVTLSLEPLPDGRTWDEKALSDRYRLRLESIRRDATLLENVTRVNPSTIETALKGLEDLLKQGWVDSEDLERIESFGRTLGEDIIQDLEASLASESGSSPDMDVHMLLQIPERLMQYPWELMHDGRSWLSERYALGRQVFMEQSAVRWSAKQRSGGLRILIIGDPLLQGLKGFMQLPGARDEAEQVATLFERLQEQVGAGLDFDRRRDVHIGQAFYREDCRSALRSGRYDIIHFAGHALFDREEPLRSGWVLSDGTLWAQEIRNTLMRSAPPWLVYANACDAAMNEARPAAKYQRDVHGLASAFVNKGVGAYLAPLWPIDDGMAMKLATDFYTLMALDRMTVGQALCYAKRRAKAAVLGSGQERDALITVPADMGLSWASLVLYGDPTQTLAHQLAARADSRLPVATTPPASPRETSARSSRARRSALHGETPLQAAPSTVLNVVKGPGMRPIDRARGSETVKDTEQELVVIERGGVRYWGKVVNGEPVPLMADDGSTVGMPGLAALAENQLRRQRGFTDYVKIVARWATGRLDGHVIEEVANQYDQDVVAGEGLLLHDPALGELRPYAGADDKLPMSDPKAAGCLLIIHGTFSKSAAPVNGLGHSFFDWAHRHYRQVLAFDHWTLSKSPLDNARMLANTLPRWIADGRHTLDIVTHSRGGLVARALVQLPLDDGDDAARIAAAVKRIVFVGTPNYGTSLADPRNWARAADLLINMVHLDALGLYGKLSGFLARLAVTEAGIEMLSGIPGLQAQNPSAIGETDFLVRLGKAKKPANIQFSGVSTNYEPRRDEAHLKLIAKLAGDSAVDQFFQESNDLVVNSRNVWRGIAAPNDPLIERKNLLLITPPDSVFEDLGPGPLANLYGVHHTNLFETEETRRFLVEQLSLP